MEEHPINQLLDISLDKVIHMIDTQKIVGHPINLGNGRTLIPISKVTFGFGAGGSEFSTKQTGKAYDLELGDELYPFGGGSGGGINISPVAFLKISQGDMEVITVEKNSSLTEKLLEVAKEYLVSKKEKVGLFRPTFFIEYRL
jgi:sporulation protein YtfJ